MVVCSGFDALNINWQYFWKTLQRHSCLEIKKLVLKLHKIENCSFYLKTFFDFLDLKSDWWLQSSLESDIIYISNCLYLWKHLDMNIYRVIYNPETSDHELLQYGASLLIILGLKIVKVVVAWWTVISISK